MSAAPGIIVADWNPPPGVHAMCTTRHGGVSVAPRDAWNLGDHVGDAPAAVAENRQILRAVACLPQDPHWLRQVHGVAVADLDVAAAGAAVPVADAAVAQGTGSVCAVLTADCLPVLLAATDGSAVGAAHAGWRGLAAGVIEATVRALRGRIAPGIGLQAWLGPAISAAHFEVGDDVRSAFLAVNPAAEFAFERGAVDRWQADLYALARSRLATLGITQVSGGNFCTYADADRFFSHRRDVQHRGLAGTGRMASLIWRQT
ncbi:MAG: peptidoglycan editing factor PgeF [Steroidobacteraceae bacterium]